MHGPSVIQQRLERLGEFGSGYGAIFTNEQLVEEPLVDLPPDAVGGGEVGGLAVAGGGQGSGEGGIDIFIGLGVIGAE